MPTVTLEGLELMRHAVAWPGYNANTKKYRHRNYFAADPEGADAKVWRGLVEQGLATSREAAKPGGLVYFFVSELGLRFIGDTRKDLP